MNPYLAMEYSELKRRRERLWTSLQSYLPKYGFSSLCYLTEFQKEMYDDLARMDVALSVISPVEKEYPLSSDAGFYSDTGFGEDNRHGS